jgi:thiol-disulfide isomerase/thioredoxin/YHS domain-containing protein
MRAMQGIGQLVVALGLAASVAVAEEQNQMPWQPTVEAAQQIAAQSNRLVLIHFWASWCAPCARLEKEVFSQAETARALDSSFVLVKLNVDEAPATARMYGVSSLPTDVIITPSGRLVASIQSPPTASQYVAQMNQAAAGHRDLARRAQVSAQQPSATGYGAPTGQPQVQNMAAAPPNTAPISNQPYNAPTTGPGAGAPAGAIAATAAPSASAPPPTQTAYSNDRFAEYFQRHPGVAPGGNQDNQTAAAANQSPSQPGQPIPPQFNPNQSPYAASLNAQPMLQTPPQNAGVVNASGQGYSQPPGQPSAQFQQPAVQLPPGTPPVGLDGFCPVTLVERNQWLPGDKNWGVVHRGRTYLFRGPDEQKKFWANPDLFSPVLSGNDPVLALDHQQSVQGKREYGVYLDNRIYLFADETSRQRFEQNPRRYSAEVLQATLSPRSGPVR